MDFRRFRYSSEVHDYAGASSAVWLQRIKDGIADIRVSRDGRSHLVLKASEEEQIRVLFANPDQFADIAGKGPRECLVDGRRVVTG